MSVAEDAVSWITPPPAPSERKRWGSPMSSAIQSSTWVSISVQAGLVAHSIPCTPRPAESSSPSTDDPERFEGKNAKKFGDCQWVTPGRTISSRSRSTASNGSPRSGGRPGSRERTSPGSTLDSTGRSSTRSQ